MNKTAADPVSVLALDVGAKRIGVARAHMAARLPQALPTITVDGNELDAIKAYIDEYEVDTLVVGWPRNLSGKTTAQTDLTDKFINRLKDFKLPIYRQDESLTSVQAEDELRRSAKRRSPLDKSAIDARAAMIILDDFLRSVS